jgi:xanthine/CO dehydrogenase XdhC/CoxF family maturation factor
VRRSSYADGVESPIAPLLPLFERERAAGRGMALAINLQTAGSTYSKAGALLLIAENGDYAGLLSGGCLEGDLRERAGRVIAEGVVERVRYDMRGPEDLLWGMGSGCEGAMDVFMLRVSAANDWQPMDWLASAQREHRRVGIGIVIETTDGQRSQGSARRIESLPVAETQADGQREHEWIFWPALSPRLLLLGAGADAQPVVRFAIELGWRVVLNDHRPTYADSARFPGAGAVISARPADLHTGLAALGLQVDDFDAVVVMSHHLDSDADYLRALATTSIAYIGLLGPAPRRERLHAMVGERVATALGARLRSPVGLDLGGRSPAAIALAIVAEIHAFLNDRMGGRFDGQR